MVAPAVGVAAVFGGLIVIAYIKCRELPLAA
jgi:hypothetical protein